jgi:uncharacterized RDD family membrane protein YckC
MSDLPPPPPPPPPSSTGSGQDAWATDRRGNAGFGARLGAYLLDSLLYGAVATVFVIVAVVLGVVAVSDCTLDEAEGLICSDEDVSAGLLLAAFAVGLGGLLLVAVIYLVALARSGQTWGRRIVGIRVVRVSDGSAPGFGRALGRTLFAGIVSSSLFYLGYLWMIWDSDRQTWHDKVSGTRVVRT